ncbi:putative Acylglycerol lipase [Paraphoma chrysanthemicola]|uniref:Acylglycerol lipase n=1 Tax=Paraphoma chrysanthemicola TaxID=798071 RepID=A0A8K0RGY6_9PLEO|nr:putative Acylglycerol lipase [Paraphoma chrysanthemicola]
MATNLNHATIKLSPGTVTHIWKPPNSPCRAVIVLQHGYAEYAERYTTSHHNIIVHLVEAGYIVYAMDFWGHGQSPGTRGIVHVGTAVRDHQELRKVAREQNPGLPIILYGHSLGGLTTAGSTVADQSDIKGVIMTGPALAEPLPLGGRRLLGLATALMPKVSIPKKADVEGLTRDQREIEKYWEDPLFHKEPISLLLGATALDVAQTVWAGFEAWKVPTLLLHGDADTYCDWKASKKFMEGITSTDKTFGIYEEGRHELLHDLEGDAVLQRMMDWIASHI